MGLVGSECGVVRAKWGRGGGGDSWDPSTNTLTSTLDSSGDEWDPGTNTVYSAPQTVPYAEPAATFSYGNSVLIPDTPIAIVMGLQGGGNSNLACAGDYLGVGTPGWGGNVGVLAAMPGVSINDILNGWSISFSYIMPNGQGAQSSWSPGSGSATGPLAGTPGVSLTVGFSTCWPQQP